MLIWVRNTCQKNARPIFQYILVQLLRTWKRVGKLQEKLREWDCRFPTKVTSVPGPYRKKTEFHYNGINKYFNKALQKYCGNLGFSLPIKKLSKNHRLKKHYIYFCRGTFPDCDIFCNVFLKFTTFL
jgi:hypothetical protein